MREMAMDGKRMRLRYPGVCAGCGAAVAKGDEAWWSAQTHAVTCLACAPDGPAERDTTTRCSSPAAGDPGVAGGSAQREYDRRHQRDLDRAVQQWGRLAGVVEFLRSEPQTTTAWAQGARGERWVARRLGTLDVNGAVLMHDRRAPGSGANIDHLAVATNGVWVIDAKNLSGTVEVRNKGGWLNPHRRLYIAGRDRTNLVEGLAWQVETVQRALGDFDDVTIHPVLCILAEWPLLAQPLELNGVRIVWPRRLAKLIAEPGPFTNVETIADRLAATLTPA